MISIADDLNIYRSIPVEEKSYLKRWISRVACLIAMVVRLFSKTAALFLLFLCVGHIAKFIFAKLDCGSVWNTLHSRTSASCIMFVVVNIVIMRLGINCGVFSFLASAESRDAPFVELPLQQTAAIEAFNLSEFSQEEGYLNMWSTLGIESSSDLGCQKHRNCQRMHSSNSMEYLTSKVEEDSFVIKEDIELLGSMPVEYRVLKSAISISTANQKVEECLTSSTPLFLLEISDGKAEIDVQFSDDVAEEGEHFNGDELFMKCENFIQNFRSQLKMQRMHEIYAESF